MCQSWQLNFLFVGLKHFATHLNIFYSLSNHQKGNPVTMTELLAIQLNTKYSVLANKGVAKQILLLKGDKRTLLMLKQ